MQKATSPWWYAGVLAAGLLAGVPHLVSFLNASGEKILTYYPSLAPLRFMLCAEAIAGGNSPGDAFSFASPLYILFLVPFHAAGAGNTAVFILQALASLLTGLLVFHLGRSLGGEKWLSAAMALLWYFYAPRAFYGMTLLPVALLSLLVCFWGSAFIRKRTGLLLSGLYGISAGLVCGFRPTFITLFPALAIYYIRKKNLAAAGLMTAGFLLPMAGLSVWHHSLSGVFAPFVPATGLNLVLGHSSGANGYGPPIPEYGLVESPSEDIHQVASRIAGEQGHTTPAEADRFWMRKAISWILSNPGEELRLIAVKTGAVMGHRPFGSYYDLNRDIGSDTSLNHLAVPRALLVVTTGFGLLMILVFKREYWYLCVPMATAILTSVAFLHSERFWLPAVPLSLAASAWGITLFSRWDKGPWLKTAIACGIAAVLLLPGFLWPVPVVPEGIYLYNRGAKAYTLGNYLLSMTLFEDAAEASDPGSSVQMQSRMEAVRIARALGLDERADEQIRLLQLETN